MARKELPGGGTAAKAVAPPAGVTIGFGARRPYQPVICQFWSEPEVIFQQNQNVQFLTPFFWGGGNYCLEGYCMLGFPVGCF